MKNQAKTQHSVFKFIRAAIPVTVLSAIQYAVISTLLVVGKIDSSMVGTRYITSVMYYCNILNSICILRPK